MPQEFVISKSLLCLIPSGEACMPHVLLFIYQSKDLSRRDNYRITWPQGVQVFLLTKVKASYLNGMGTACPFM